jgi:hypothetical protein
VFRSRIRRVAAGGAALANGDTPRSAAISAESPANSAATPIVTVVTRRAQSRVVAGCAR